MGYRARVRIAFAIALCSFLVGCGSDDASQDSGSGGSGGSAGSGAVAGTGGSAGSGGVAGSGATSTADEALFQKALAGEIAPSDALEQIALSDGFPIAVSGGFLFGHLDDGLGPYSVAGDFDAWSGQPMTLEAGLYWTVVSIPNPDGVKYKLVDGAGVFAADPFARRYAFDELGEISLVRSSAAHRERFPAVAGAGLLPRTVRAWVSSNATTHHLYVHDGQNLFDPNAPFGGWKLDEVVSATTLVIGVDNTADRVDEYTHAPDVYGGSTLGGRGDEYSDFVLQVVRPLVEAHYGAPERVGVMGSSLGGLISFHEALRNPGSWDFAASLSGTFGWGSIGATNETLIERWQKAGKQSTKLYLDSGGGPGAGCVDSDGDGIQDDANGAQDNYCETAQLRDVLAASGYEFDVDLWHWYEPGALHNEAAWAARVFHPVQIFEGL